MSNEPTERVVLNAGEIRHLDTALRRDPHSDGFYDVRNAVESIVAERIAEARRESAAEGWADALRWVRQYAENTSPDMAIQHIDRAEPFNPYQATR